MATRIIALSGPAGSGKSEAASHLAKVHGFTVVKFAGPLKAMLRGFYNSLFLLSSEDIERRIEGDLKEVPDPYLNGRTPRHAMITIGTEWGRDMMSDDFWLTAWMRSVEAAPGPVVVDDCRFVNEASLVKHMGGTVIQLKPKVQRRKKNDAHVSEVGLPSHLVDHTVTNDGTVNDLKDKITDILWPLHSVTFG